jgi:hypothetical protein
MELITKYFPDLDADKVELLKKLMPLYEEWNSKINVISRKDMDQFSLTQYSQVISFCRWRECDGYRYRWRIPRDTASHTFS